MADFAPSAVSSTCCCNSNNGRVVIPAERRKGCGRDRDDRDCDDRDDDRAIRVSGLIMR